MRNDSLTFLALCMQCYIHVSLYTQVCFISILLVRPKTIVFGRTYVLRTMFFYFLKIFSTREISEMRGPTGVKFCTMVSTRPIFIMLVQNFGGAPQKNFRGQKHARLRAILDDFEVRRRISQPRMKIFKIG